MLRRVALVPGTDPAISHSGLGQDQPGSGGLVSELAPQGAHVDAKVVALLCVAGAPDGSQEPLVGQELAGVGHEGFQERVLSLGQVDRSPVERDEATAQVDLEIARADDRRGGVAAVAPPEGGPQTGEHFLDPEGLRDVVVGPRVQRRHLVGLAVPDREHDDRDLRERADTPDHLGAVQVGKAEVQEQELGSDLGGRHDRLAAGADRAHLVAVRLQARPHRAPDLGLVVADEHAGHRRTSSRDTASCGIGEASRPGSSNTTAAPPPGAPSTQMRPPCASTIAREIASPSPLPPLASGPPAPSWVKASNTRSRSAGAMPGPWSATRTWTAERHGTTEIVTSPPGGENRTAFSSRFDTT